MSNEKLIDEVVKISAETAVRTALEIVEKEKLKQQKSNRDRRLRNTKLLLKHYRSFKLHCVDLKLELKELEVPDDMFEELHSNEFLVESIKRSKERTLAIIGFIDQMIAVYQVLCERSGREEEIRRFQTIHKMYISEEVSTADQISEGHKVNRRTVYKDIDKACQTLSALIFGVDMIKID